MKILKYISIVSILSVSACGSLVEVNGPSFGASECPDGQILKEATTGGVKVGPFVAVNGPSMGKCVEASKGIQDYADEDSQNPDENDELTNNDEAIVQ